ncbi:hypothetical protein [Sulfitobacter geojensis]|uniref:hypothetical protein n=1 Tax=Sulfitobacter geojensis TaxID=1342299 RepID=UPI0036DA2D1B
MASSLISLPDGMIIAKEELDSKIKNTFEAAVYPLYCPDIKSGDRPVHAGSAFAMEYQSKIFVVTAAHVISHIPEARSRELFMGFPSLEPQSIGTSSTEAKTVLKNDSDDFAVIELYGSLENLVRNQGFVSEGQLSFYGEGHEEHYYVCLGYPHSRNKIWEAEKRGIPMQMVAYETMLQNDTWNLEEAQADPVDHLTLQRAAKRSRDPNGNMKNPYGMQGMSGGLVVDAGALATAGVIGDTSGTSPKAIAIIIEYYPSPQTIKALRLSVLKSAMQSEGFWA